MTISEALRLLDLPVNYQEQDLKRQYRAKMKEFHPDCHSKEEPDKIDYYNRMTQKINVANYKKNKQVMKEDNKINRDSKKINIAIFYIGIK